MRIRKINDKDISRAADLMCRQGFCVDEDVLRERRLDFQYKRNHTVVVVTVGGRMLSIMHIGIEPSLMRNRTAKIFSMFIDEEAAPKEMRTSLLAYGRSWAKQHGCELIYTDSTKGSLMQAVE